MQPVDPLVLFVRARAQRPLSAGVGQPLAVDGLDGRDVGFRRMLSLVLLEPGVAAIADGAEHVIGAVTGLPR